MLTLPLLRAGSSLSVSPGVSHYQAPYCSLSPTSWVPTIPEMLCLCTESCLQRDKGSLRPKTLPSAASQTRPAHELIQNRAEQAAGLQVKSPTWLWLWALDSCRGVSRALCSRSPFMPADPGATGLETVAGTHVSSIPGPLAATPLLCWPTPEGPGCLRSLSFIPTWDHTSSLGQGPCLTSQPVAAPIPDLDSESSSSSRKSRSHPPARCSICAPLASLARSAPAHGPGPPGNSPACCHVPPVPLGLVRPLQLDF